MKDHQHSPKKRKRKDRVMRVVFCIVEHWNVFGLGSLEEEIKIGCHFMKPFDN